MSDGRTNATPQGSAGISLAGGLLLFLPISLLGDQVGSLLQYPEIGAAVFYLPYATLTVALIVTPRRDWVWYVLIATLTHFFVHWPRWSVSWVLVASLGNAVRALTAATLLGWLFTDAPRLDSIYALLRFVAAAALLAPALGATIGASNVVLHGEPARYWTVWSGWFMSNALTGLTALAAFLHVARTISRGRQFRMDRRRMVEGLLLAVALAATCAVAFLGSYPRSWAVALYVYLPLPLLIWAALRFGPGGASLGLTVVAVAAISGVDRGTAPFLAGSRDQDVLALQLFVLLTTFPVLCIAAIAGARHDAVQLYRALLASREEQVAILDARGIVLEVNASWRQFAASSVGERFYPARPGDDFLATCRAAAEGGSATATHTLVGLASVLDRERRRFEMEYDHEHDGRREVYAVRIDALERFDGGAVVTRANVTARRQAQREIEEQRRELSHLARVSVLGELSGALAHELSQPLASIRSNAEAALLLLPRQPAKVDDILAILRDIVRDNERAAQVIHRLSALLRRGEAHLQPMDTAELVRDVLELAHGELIARRVTVTSVVEPDLPDILGDRVQLQQVLLNLILNACEAMSGVAVPDRRALLTVATEGGSHVHLALRDTGTGIPPALVCRLFEPFVTTKPEGLGLGLSISRTIVAAHGGRLWAENNADRGATLHCVLPCAPSPSPTAPSAQPFAVGSTPPFPRSTSHS